MLKSVCQGSRGSGPRRPDRGGGAAAGPGAQPTRANEAQGKGSSDQIAYKSKKIHISAVNGQDVIKRLKAEGWRVKRVRGSHHLMEKAGRVVPVPVHGAADIGKGLLAEIERQTGVKFNG